MSSILKVSEIQDPTGKKVLQNTGSILQVVNHSYTTNTTTTGGFVDAGGSSFTITPTSATNKILIMADTSFQFTGGGGERPSGQALINYNGSNIDPQTNAIDFLHSVVDQTFYIRMSRQVYVTAASTSAVTIKIQVAKYNGTNAQVNGAAGSTSYVTAMEISA
tara:strand:+ start:1083 stop:1571 length:489 start_codon:yes stop_codon:yes gene_type:complete